MEFNDIRKYQLDISKELFNADHTKPDDFKELMKKLQFGTIALSGEVGEFANVVKKMMRFCDVNKQEEAEKKLPHLREELTDVFSYTLILSENMGMDLEKEFFAKMEKNKERFKNLTK